MRNDGTDGFPFRGGALYDDVRIGSFCPILARTVNTTDTVLAHALGRVPSGYFVIRNTPGGVVYDGTAGGSDWTATSITLRATVGGSYGLLLF